MTDSRALILCLFAVLSVPHASQAEVLGAENPAFAQVASLFDRVEALKKESPVLCSALSCCVGKDIGEIAAHYKEMFSDMALMLKPNAADEDLGIGDQGYRPAATHFTDARVAVLAKNYAAAIKDFASKKGSSVEMSWDEWKNRFPSKDRPQGDELVALQGILLSNYWVRLGAGRENELADIAASDPSLSKQATLYSVGSFSPQAFDLELPFDPDKAAWGKAYKVFAGMNFAMALHERGYSPADIRLAVRQANIFYEAHDTLYDHLAKKSKCGSTACQDAPNKDLAPFYDKWIVHVKDKLASQPSLKSEVMATAMGMPGLKLAMGPAAASGDLWSDELKLQYLLTGYRVQDPEAFRKNFGTLFDRVEKGESLKENFDAADADIRYMESGVDFALEKLKDYPQKNKKFEGIVPKLSKIEQMCKKVDGASKLIESFNPFSPRAKPSH